VYRFVADSSALAAESATPKTDYFFDIAVSTERVLLMISSM
jgi:hypothetical protein